VLLPSNRNTFLTKNSQQLKSVVQLIDETLADHDKLLARTRIRKNARIGDATDANGEVVNDEENFDDTDFYQQLLRDVIDARGNGADDWMAVQRQKKAKKTVDTKASKGRKVR
jgi:protein AATF/BFR2